MKKKLLLAALGLFVVVAVGAFADAGLSPLAFYEKATRGALAEAGLELRTLAASSGELAYWQGGEGPVVVLVHGVGDQAGAFQGVVPALLESYRVVLPDLPGHGDSEPAAGSLKMSTVYAGLAELIEATAGDAPPSLVGHSMGAWLVTVYAHRNPDRVERIVLMNGGALTGDRPDLSLMPADREAARTLMAALRDPASPPTPDYVLDDIVRRSASGPIARMVAELADLQAHLLDGRLDEVTVPVDLLWGASDQLMSLAYAERMAAQLPRARLSTIPGCGHHPPNECPGKLAPRLTEVLAMELPAPEAPSETAVEESEGVGTETAVQ